MSEEGDDIRDKVREQYQRTEQHVCGVCEKDLHPNAQILFYGVPVCSETCIGHIKDFAKVVLGEELE